MTPPSPSGSMGRRPVLEWTEPAGRVSRASIGPYVLLAWDTGWWEVRANSEAVRYSHAANTLTDARNGAEEACKALLCSALAAFADGAPEGFRAQPWAARVEGREVYLETPDTGDLGRACSMSYADARSLALSLLRASESTSTPGGRWAGTAPLKGGS